MRRPHEFEVEEYERDERETVLAERQAIEDGTEEP